MKRNAVVVIDREIVGGEPSFATRILAPAESAFFWGVSLKYAPWQKKCKKPLTSFCTETILSVSYRARHSKMTIMPFSLFVRKRQG